MLHRLHNIMTSLFIKNSSNLHHTSSYTSNSRTKQQSPLTPHINHHEPNYKVRTPPLPWIEGRSIIFRLNSRSAVFPLFPAASRSSSKSLFFYCLFFLFLLTTIEQPIILYSLLGSKLIHPLITFIPSK